MTGKLFEDLESAGVVSYHFEDVLYFKATPVTAEILNQNPDKHKLSLVFRNTDRNGELWYEVPLAYFARDRKETGLKDRMCQDSPRFAAGMVQSIRKAPTRKPINPYDLAAVRKNAPSREDDWGR